MVEAVRGDDLLDVGGRAGDRDQARIVDVVAQIVDEIGIGVDRDQPRVGAQRSRIGRVKVPTPGPYSTNSLVAPSRPGPASCRSGSSLDGMTDPTITGCLRKPRRNCQRGLAGARRRGGVWPLS